MDLARQVRVVLDNLSEKIRECYRHAEDCERQAGAQADPGIRADFLDTADRWIKLARSYEFTERLTRFTAHQPKPLAHEYRLCMHDHDGRPLGPAIKISADNDEAAAALAARSVGRFDAELRDGVRVVRRLTAKE